MLDGIRRIGFVSLTVFLAIMIFWPTPASQTLSKEYYGPPAPIFHTLDITPPKMLCEAAFLQDNSTSEKLYGKDEYNVRPIASITKLITALTFLDFKVDWDNTIEMDTFDVNNSSRSPLRAGDVYRVRDLFHSSLMSSDNRATRALARSTGVSIDSFIVLMNRKVDSLGLYSIKVDEVTGLSENNVASAFDIARLVNIASSNETIQSTLCTKQYTYISEKRKRLITLGNTNRLLSSSWRIEGGKTGYIGESGYCFAVRVNDDKGHDLTGVVLGARSNSRRFKEAAKLFQWAFAALEKVQASTIGKL
jgi:serine-type D-Ala-D-Ala endopeptidase (penicillin-binding protein 7)